MSEKLIPTAGEIEEHRKVMEAADSALCHEHRDYSDESVIRSLTERMPDSGGTTLGELRALDSIAKATAHI